MVDLLKIGSNSKLGKGIASFNIPAIINCPGRTALCESVCYASRALFMMQKARHQTHKDAAEQSDFVSIINTQLSKGKIKAVRIHAAGDFYSTEYINKWTAIAEANPSVKFWTYTRSWRIKEMLPALEKMAKVPNLQLFGSVDDECRNEKIPSWLRVADIQVDWIDDKSTVQCPNLKNKKITCEKCTYCFKPPTKTKQNVLFKIH